MNVMYLNGGIDGITSWNGLVEWPRSDPASRKLLNLIISR